MRARAVSATWATPQALLAAMRATETAERQFARVLLAIYAVFIVVALCSLPRWLLGVYRVVVDANPGSLAVLVLVSVAYPVLMVSALVVVRRRRRRTS